MQSITNKGKTFTNVKNVVLPHSQAKLDLYRDYLNEYLPVLGSSPFISKINIYDIFCGAGIYEDGKLGSPLIAASCILNHILTFQKAGKSTKPIKLVINDKESHKVNNVKQYIDELGLNNCEVIPYNYEASQMFSIVQKELISKGRNERSLIFVDPYGYTDITKNNLLGLLDNQRSEVILFLPISHLYRFSEISQIDINRKCYDNLRIFIDSFFDTASKSLLLSSEDVFQYIEQVRLALSFNQKFFTSSHYIKRDRANHYAVFFIGHHIYGLEKFLEAKWKNDSLGAGFNNNSTPNLFGSTIEEYDKLLTEQRLENLLRSYLQSNSFIQNKDLYRFVLTNQFLPNHANPILKKWTALGIIELYDNRKVKLDSYKSKFLTHDSMKDNSSVIFVQLKKKNGTV
jgi:three-Cys-motif partner protein